jgi:septum formation protein
MSRSLVLASGSPRRSHLLAAAGYEFEVVAPHVDEIPAPGEDPDAMVERLAEAKARVVSGAKGDEACVLGCDTTVVFGGYVLGKPQDAADAVAMLLRIAGSAHTVISGYAILVESRTVIGTVTSTVEMMPIDRDAAEAYAATGEPLDKAGSYAIQGIGRQFVASYSGSFSNIMGLPLEEIVPRLQGVGVDPVRAPEPLPR